MYQGVLGSRFFVFIIEFCVGVHETIEEVMFFGLQQLILLPDVGEEAIEDGEVVQIVGGGLHVFIDEGQQFEVEVFSLPDQLDEGIDGVD